MSDTKEHEGTFEAREEAERSPSDLVRFWREQIDLASKTEKDWREDAQKACDLYADTKTSVGKRSARFNVLYANTETLSSALYNSLPSPDVRRRFGDADPVGKAAADILERSLSCGVDDPRFNATVEACVHDMVLPGRGVARVRYEATAQGQTLHQQVPVEYARWSDFRMGPAITWYDVPWIAFKHGLTRTELVALSPEVGPQIAMATEEKAQRDGPKQPPSTVKTTLVWEIWDKEQRQIVWIAEGYDDAPLRADPDPLGLLDFFPIPMPLRDVQRTDSMVPICPYNLYADQAEELNVITRRITSLVRVMKARGVYAGDMEALARLDSLDDGELLPVEQVSAMAAGQAGAFDRMIWLWPVDRLQQVLAGLYEQREQIKRVIYEVTGISDILRGQTDANETATAQGIKAQWGSLRLQRRQAEVQRFVRDILRLQAEIIAEKFEPPALAEATGIQLPTAEQKQQAQQMLQMQSVSAQPGMPPPEPPPEVAQMLQQPTWEEVMQVLRSDAMRTYRVDVETDSTIRADTQRAQQNIASFIQGFGQFMQAVGPAVQAGAMPLQVASDLLVSFARVFKLGRQAEDALERMGKEGQVMPQAGPAPPDPATVQMEQQRGAADVRKAEAGAQAAEANAFKAVVEAQALPMKLEAEAMRAAQPPQAIQ